MFNNFLCFQTFRTVSNSSHMKPLLLFTKENTNRSKLHPFLLTFLILFSGIAACSTYNQESFEEEIVVEAYLIAQRPLPEVRVSKTAPVFEAYSFEDKAINNAMVIIQELTDQNAVDREFAFQLKESGIYAPSDQSYKVKEQQRYRLIVQTDIGVASSITTVPKQFSSTPPTSNEIVYQGAEQFEVAVTPTSTPERQTSFIFSVLSEDAEFGNLTPFYASILEDDDETTLEDLILVSSPIINEANYDPIDDGNFILIRLPWISVAFYGANQVIASSLDNNLFDFVRSQSVQLGGGALAPGEIQNIINRIDGGIGIFGSMTTDTTRVIIIPPDFNLGVQN